MTALLSDPEFWKALPGLLWPLVLLVLLGLYRAELGRFLQGRKVTLKVAGLDLTLEQAAEKTGTDLAALQERVAEIETRLGTRLGPQALAKAAPSRSVSVLWADDRPENNAFLLDRLQKDGVRVRTVRTTAEALAAFEAGGVDLVITDLGRTEGGRDLPFAGRDLTQALRARGAAVPVVVYAGPRALAMAGELRAAGASLVTASPVEIFAAIQALREGRG